MEKLLVADTVSKSFGDYKALNDISIEVPKGSIFGLLGPNGAGKTTLLQILGTLDKPDSGELIINNTPVHNLNDKKISKFRNNDIGFVFQFHHLLPEFTAIETEEIEQQELLNNLLARNQ